MTYTRKFFSGFCCFNTQALMAEEWTSVGSASFGTGNNGVGFSCINPQNCVVSAGDPKFPLAQVAGWTLHMSVQLAPAGGLAQEIFRVEDLVPNVCVQLLRQPSGKLRLACPNGSGVTATDTVVTLADNTYYAIDVGYFQSGTVGRVEVRVNGARITALTSSAYSGGTNAGTNTGPFVPASLRLVNSGGGGSVTFDYIGIKQDTAAWLDTPTQVWPGVQLKGVSRPNGNGQYATGSQWSNVGGGGNSTDLNLPIDETVNDHDTSYDVYNGIPASVTSDRMSVTMDNAPSNVGTIAWVCNKQSLRSSPGGVSSTVKIGIDCTRGADTLLETSPFTIDSSQAWRYFQQNLDTAPSGAAWTPNLLSNSDCTTLAVTLA